MKNTLTVNVVSPMEQILNADNIIFIKVKGSRGDIGIMPNHANYVTSLGAGQMLIRFDNKEEKSYFVEGGFLEVRDNKVLVIAEDIFESSKEEIIRKERKEAIDRAINEKLKEDKDILGTKKRIHDSLSR